MPEYLLPSPEQLALYAELGPEVLLAVIAARQEAAKMEYRYAVAGLFIAALGLLPSSEASSSWSCTAIHKQLPASWAREY